MNHELPVQVTICQSILDAKNMETAMLSFAEMGVTDVIPVKAEKVYHVPTAEREAWKVQRWNSCARVYVRNSLREVTPVVHKPIGFAEAIKMAKDYDVAILCYENEHDPLCTAKALAECKDAKSVIVFIGCEEGFTTEEVELAKSNGVKIVTLGNRIIRACNAGAIFMGMLTYVLELGGGDTNA